MNRCLLLLLGLALLCGRAAADEGRDAGQLARKKAEREAERARAEAERRSVEDAIRAAEKESAGLPAELEKARKEAARADAEFQKQDARRRNIEKNIGPDKTWKTKEEAKAHFGDYEAEHEKAKQKKAEADQRVADLERKSAALPGEMDALRKKLAGLKNRTQALDEEIKRLGEEIEKGREGTNPDPAGGKADGTHPGDAAGGTKPETAGPPATYPAETEASDPLFGTCAYLITIGPGTGPTEVDHSAVSINGVVYSWEGKGMVTYPSVGAYLQKRRNEGRQVWVNPILKPDKPAMLAKVKAIMAAKAPYNLLENNCAVNALEIMIAGNPECAELKGRGGYKKPMMLKRFAEESGFVGRAITIK